MNHHTLSDFRVAHATLLERLLATGVAALVAEGLVVLDVLAQDGLRVRAAAGAVLLRRRRRLEAIQAAVAIDGKTLRRSFDQGRGNSPLHIAEGQPPARPHGGGRAFRGVLLSPRRAGPGRVRRVRGHSWSPGPRRVFASPEAARLEALGGWPGLRRARRREHPQRPWHRQGRERDPLFPVELS